MAKPTKEQIAALQKQLSIHNRNYTVLAEIEEMIKEKKLPGSIIVSSVVQTNAQYLLPFLFKGLDGMENYTDSHEIDECMFLSKMYVNQMIAAVKKLEELGVPDIEDVAVAMTKEDWDIQYNSDSDSDSEIATTESPKPDSSSDSKIGDSSSAFFKSACPKPAPDTVPAPTPV